MEDGGEEEEEDVAGARDEELGEAAKKREVAEEKGCAKCRDWQVGVAVAPTTAKAAHRDGAAASTRPRGAGRILRKEFMAVVLCDLVDMGKHGCRMGQQVVLVRIPRGAHEASTEKK